jgi:enamine deaminase RidA (YjgF/YER057c/UK114 family)
LAPPYNTGMPTELRNVAGRPETPYYHHVSIASGDRLIHVAGQVGTDEHGRLVSGGLAAQAERALLNVGLALDAAGAAETDLVKLTIYVVGFEQSKFPELGAGLGAAREARGFPAVPASLIGVQALFEPEMLVEIEAVAVSS